VNFKYYYLLLINIDLKLRKLHGFLVMMLIGLVGYGQSTTNYSDKQVVNWVNWREDYTISLVMNANQELGKDKVEAMENSLQTVFDELEKEKEKSSSDKKLLSAVFTKLFDTYLHKYKALTDFEKTIQKKEFDCLTGTLLFTLVLEKLDFQYAIHETNYHVYLTVNTKEGEVLIEATDRQFGLETNAFLIQKRRRSYHQQYEKLKEANKEKNVLFDKIDRQIDLHELIGLQYFNKAINAYNQKEYEKAIIILKQSMQLYDADRSAGLMVLIIDRYLQSADLQASKKEKLMHYQDFYAHKLATKVRY
jgi:tetratricopeptide (TPR) repeat protein